MTDRELPGFGELVGAMLGAHPHRIYACGSGQEDGTPGTEEYWSWGSLARLATPSMTVTTGPVATIVRVRGRRVEQGPGKHGWLGWTDRLLRPEQLYVWGRPGEDWRWREVMGWSNTVEGAAVVTIEHLEDDRVGEAHVLPGSGRVMVLDLPGFLHWELDSVDDSPDVAAWPAKRWFGGCAASDHPIHARGLA